MGNVRDGRRPRDDPSRRKVSAQRSSRAVPVRLVARSDAARISVFVDHRRGGRVRVGSHRPRRIPRFRFTDLVPGVWHRYRPIPAVGWTERWFSFNGEAIQQLLDTRHFGPQNAVSHPQDAERLAEEFDEVLDAIRDRSVGDPIRINFQAMRIISEAVAQQIEGSRSSGDVADRLAAHRDDPIVQRALEIIWTHSPFPMSVSDIARQLPVTRRTLDRRFVEATGHSVLEEINACRLSRAKRLLTETDLPVKTVAHLAGFSSTERMRVLFVEREGVSPISYRKRITQSRPKRDTTGCPGPSPGDEKA